MVMLMWDMLCAMGINYLFVPYVHVLCSYNIAFILWGLELIRYLAKYTWIFLRISCVHENTFFAFCKQLNCSFCMRFLCIGSDVK